MAEAIPDALKYVTDAVTGQTTEIPFDLANSGDMPTPLGGVAMSGVAVAVGTQLLINAVVDMISDKRS
jgi:hypothetical protein